MPQPVDIVGLLESGIRAEETRQRTIASNIANLETPGYRRLDVRFEELLTKEKQKKEAVDERFSQAKSLEQAKKKKAAEFFEQTIKEK